MIPELFIPPKSKICDKAWEVVKQRRGEQMQNAEMEHFMITEKVCPKCGCTKILLHGKKPKTTIECEDCGYTVYNVWPRMPC